MSCTSGQRSEDFFCESCKHGQPSVVLVRVEDFVEPGTKPVSIFEKVHKRWLEKCGGGIENDEVDFDDHCAMIYGRTGAEQEKKGRTRQKFDMLIAATAIANNMILVTRNTADFEDIPGLMLENWFESEEEK